MDANDYIQSDLFYYLPNSMEERLTNGVKSGDEEYVHALLEEIYATNVIKMKISPQMMHFLVNNLQGIVIKLIHEIDSSFSVEKNEFVQKITNLTDQKDLLIRIQEVNQLIEEICRIFECNKAENKDEKKKKEIEDYISCNYADKELCLESIAKDFGYEKTYFSKIFKRLFDKNFANYLEQMRIEKVCEFLKSGENLEGIADKCGYNSVAVMRVAFKRVKGMVPKEYRDIYISRMKDDKE